MLLSDGYHDLPPGMLGTVVTYLEMRARVAARPERADGPWVLRRVESPAVDWYRDLYRRVGTDWLWMSRLVMPDAELRGILLDAEVELHALEVDGRAEGMLELDRRITGECEVAFFGLTPKLVGTGAGRWLMNRAIGVAFARPITRLWLHTCSLDSPDALDFYLRSGFVPYDRKVEVFDDPRVLGVLPRSAAPQVPLIEPR
jgi:GNAT superfamily N-acetyltransferase